MNNTQNRDTDNTTRQYISEDISHIFEQLDPQTVEHFAKGYQLWTLQRQIETLHNAIASLKQEIAENDEQMQQVQPSAIALATLVQLQASGVDDIDLLERMYERGEIWLDHTKQILEHCEHLDVIRGDYKQWCEHALEGAYDWIESINDADSTQAPSQDTDQQLHKPFEEATEALLLQKLMSEDGEITPAQETAEVIHEEVTQSIEADYYYANR